MDQGGGKTSSQARLSNANQKWFYPIAWLHFEGKRTPFCPINLTNMHVPVPDLKMFTRSLVSRRRRK